MIPVVNKDFDEEKDKIKKEIEASISGMELQSEKQEARISDFEVKDEKDASFVLFNMRNDKFALQDHSFKTSTSDNDDDNSGGDDEEEEEEERNDETVISSSSGVSVSGGDTYKSLLSEFDDFVANEKIGAMVGTSRALSYRFEDDDMVWGKVKSHPWWPGLIFNEAVATSSVRRTLREGHLLVAFFGDSSYGWFDPAELIAFDVNFTEKSQQTNSRNFVKAVEEAADEASRRFGLGLTCKCRNPYNFRPANVQGYFVVDVPNFEPGGVYSSNQIRKARDGFRPGETLEFLKQLALGLQEYDWNTIDFIKNKATVLAFRKAVFEEFDETYAQAFGVQSSRPSIDKAKEQDEPAKRPSRAPLSGPLVIAETLRDGKSSKKPIKVKDNLKKDIYLLKRREEPNDSEALPVDQRQPTSSTPAVHVEGSSVMTDGDYMLQKRAPPPNIYVEHEQAGLINKEGAGPSDVTGKEPAAFAQAPGSYDKDAQQENKGRVGVNVAVEDTSTGRPDLPGRRMLQGVTNSSSPSFQPEGETMVERKYEGSAKVARLNEDSQQTSARADHKYEGSTKMARLNEDSQQTSARAEGEFGLAIFQDGNHGSHLLSFDAKLSTGKNSGVLKRPLGHVRAEDSVTGEKRKKKKKELDAETDPDRLKKHLAMGKIGMAEGKSTGKSTQMSLASKVDPRINQQKKDVETLPIVGAGNIELELWKLLSDLHALALDPFHVAERSSPSVAMQFFLRFRSRVYQKSFVASPQSETSDPAEFRSTKSPSIAGMADNSSGENARDLTALKPVKPIGIPDDRTKAGRKHFPSDRQEEIAAKRLKKITRLKSLAAEKKVAQRSLETQRADGKEPVAQAPPKPVKLDSIKKMERPARAVEPTMLVMKFPPETSLPSAAELKARFARFGSIDQSAIRVFWKSSQCRVVFRRKLDAQAAYKYAVSNTSLFGNVNVRYNLRELGAPASEALETDRGRGDDVSTEATRAKDLLTERPASALAHQPLLQSTVQLKSIWKKPTGDEAGQVTSGKGTPRVKFMLGGEESSRVEQLMVGNRNNINGNASFADGGASTSVAMDTSTKNFQNDIPPSPLPILPFPAQFAKGSFNNSHHTEIAPSNLHNPSAPSATPSNTPSMDISQQMLSLLTRCNDVVSSVTSLLGHVPYHPL